MNFETAFAHYRDNTATAEETALVERELAKYRLIEDYLAAHELPELPEDSAACTATPATPCSWPPRPCWRCCCCCNSRCRRC